MSQKVEVIMATFILWLILLFISWPIALLAVVLYPLLWLLSLPFRLIGITLSTLFEIVVSIIKLPLKLLKGPSII